MYISQHPEIEAKLVQELQDIGVCASIEGKPPRKLIAADLQKLSYLQCVIKVRDASQGHFTDLVRRVAKIGPFG